MIPGWNLGKITSSCFRKGARAPSRKEGNKTEPVTGAEIELRRKYSKMFWF